MQCTNTILYVCVCEVLINLRVLTIDTLPRILDRNFWIGTYGRFFVFVLCLLFTHKTYLSTYFYYLAS